MAAHYKQYYFWGRHKPSLKVPLPSPKHDVAKSIYVSTVSCKGIFPSPKKTFFVVASASEPETTIVSGRPYDVFLSFRGDTRYGFTDYLYHDLVDANIRTCRDREKLLAGDMLGTKLYEAIEESKIAIIVFSKGYAESKWCLRELTKIASCKKKESLQIIPILYDVTHEDVQDYQKGCYKQAFEKYANEAELEEWKNGFAMFAGFDKLVGHSLNETGGFQAELVKKIVKRVSSDLQIKDVHLPENLVGMDSHIRELEDRLNSTESNHDVRVIRILGMSGIGKTTIAKFFYNKFNYQFDSHHCFLEDVGGRSQQDDGLIKLQKQLVSNIKNGEEPNIEDVHKGADQIKETIKGKKVFIVLDNVDSKYKIEMLLNGGGEALRSICKPGSLFIITTTNENIPPASEVTSTYRPPQMGKSDAVTLFCLHAYNKDRPPENFVSLTEDVVSSAGGLPLDLVILGSLLSVEKDTTLWEATLMKLKAIPRMEVLERLRIGYDALDYEQKQIFLDIACFFSGERKEYPEYMWKDCDFHPSEGIDALVRRSLITVGESDNIIRMHDKLIQLGKQIVKEKAAELYLKVPRKRSRLWDQREALETLTNYQGAEKVEALNLNLEKVTKDEYEKLVQVTYNYIQSEYVQTSGEQEKQYIRRLLEKNFSHLPNLRFLRLGYVSLYGDFRGLFSNLRWLEWRCCQNFIPIIFYPKNLVILDLSNSAITDGWERWTSFKAAEKLKALNLSGCKSLRRAPDFFTTLEMLNLSRTQLELEQINSWLSKLAALRALDVSYCDIKNLDCSTLEHLENLNASHCQHLTTLGKLSNLKKLKELDIKNCPKLTKMQDLGELESLERLDMTSCKGVKRLPDLSNLTKLKTMLLSKCEKLVAIGGLGGLVSMEYLDLSYCSSIVRLPVVSNSRKLQKLSLNFCGKLSVIEGLGGLESLEILNMHTCRSVQRFPDLSNARMLKVLILHYCTNLEPQVDDLGGLESLENLNLVGCKSMVRLPNLPNPRKLQELNLSECANLREIKGFSDFVSLEILNLSNCTSLENTFDFSNLKSLKSLSATGLKHWEEIKGLEEHKSLEGLTTMGCTLLKKLPDFSNFQNMNRLLTVGCKSLAEIKGLKELKERRCYIKVDQRLDPLRYNTRHF